MNDEREVRIYGRLYKVRGDDPERIERAAAHVHEMMVRVLGDPGGGLNASDAVLASLNMADQWMERDDRDRRAVADLVARTEELIRLLPE